MVPNNSEKSTVIASVVGMADRMVAERMRDSGVKRPEAERSVARNAGLSPSAIDNLRRGRLKNGDAIGGRIQRAFVAFLERQIAALESELAIARLAEREVDFGAAEVAIAEAKRALGEGADR